MKPRHYRPLVIVALVLVGCGLSPGTETPTRVVNTLTEAGNYHLLSTSTPAGISSVTPSSTRSSYFSVSNVWDGKLSSAWGPAAEDATPTLTFNLDGGYLLDALAIKLSLGQYSSSSNHRVLVDVAVATGGSAWNTIATGLTPSETVLSQLDLPDTSAERVRLTFHVGSGLDISQLLVCEARLLACGSSPSSTPPSMPPSTPPSWVPSATPDSAPASPAPSSPADLPATTPPEALPSAAPSSVALPSVAPTPNGCADVRGAGSLTSPGTDLSYTVNAQLNAHHGVSGKIQVRDNLGGVTYKGDVTAISLDLASGDVTLSGDLAGGGAFTLTAIESSTPGKADSFSFSAGGYSASGLLSSGNVRINQVDCP